MLDGQNIGNGNSVVRMNAYSKSMVINASLERAQGQNTNGDANGIIWWQGAELN